MLLPVVAVSVTGRGLPHVTWPCRRCDRPEVHACTGRFRVNANGRLLDVWLLYVCRRCGATRKLEVAERAPAGTLDVDRLDAAGYGRDGARLRRAGATPHGDEFDLAITASVPAGPVRLEIAFSEPLLVRLEAVIAVVLGTSRSSVRRRLDAGEIHVHGAPPRAARTLRLWHGATIEVQTGH